MQHEAVISFIHLLRHTLFMQHIVCSASKRKTCNCFQFSCLDCWNNCTFNCKGDLRRQAGIEWGIGLTEGNLCWVFCLCVRAMRQRTKENKVKGLERTRRWWSALFETQSLRQENVHVSVWECTFYFSSLYFFLYVCVCAFMNRTGRPFPKGNICTFQTNCVRKTEAEREREERGESSSAEPISWSHSRSTHTSPHALNNKPRCVYVC